MIQEVTLDGTRREHGTGQGGVPIVPPRVHSPPHNGRAVYALLTGAPPRLRPFPCPAHPSELGDQLVYNKHWSRWNLLGIEHAGDVLSLKDNRALVSSTTPACTRCSQLLLSGVFRVRHVTLKTN
ncbi:uncharacterized protein LOC135337659 [Halichondria panicea]|uniref:uncharacterized protein LOC135337659 n=1 Tax=Halichondria panicea TaxID=6063 RepID=UPI00312B9607